MTPVDGNASLNVKKLRISTTEQSFKAPSNASAMEGGGLNWDLPASGSVRLPVYNRYASACLFEMSSGGGLGALTSSPDMVAALWLRDITDDEEQDIRIPVIKSNKLKQLRQNYSETSSVSPSCIQLLTLVSSSQRSDRQNSRVRDRGLSYMQIGA